MPTPKGFNGKPVQLQQLLDAAKKPQPGLGGAMGVVVAKQKSSFTIQQPTLFVTAKDAPGGSNVTNYTPAGSPGKPLEVSVGPSTAFAGSASLSSLKVGELVMIAGAPRGPGLSATYVVPALMGQQAAQAPAAQPLPEETAPESRVPANVRRDAALTTVDDAFTYLVAPPDQPAYGFLSPVFSAPVPMSPCASFRFVYQTDMQIGQYVNFPFTVGYDRSPPGYAATASGYKALPNVAAWTQLLAAKPSGSGSPYSVQLGINFAFGVVGTFVSTCPKTPAAIGGKPVRLVSASFSYGVLNATSDSMPAAGASIALASVHCLNNQTPPVKLPYALADLKLSICDPAEIDGADVRGAIARVTGGSMTGSPVVSYDPADGTELLSGPTLKPAAAQMSFALTFPYHSGMAFHDRFQFQIDGLGSSVVRTPALPPEIVAALDFGKHLKAADVPVTIFAAEPLCITLTSGTPSSSTGTVCSGQSYSHSVNAALCYPTKANACTGIDESATVALTEKNYKGTIWAAQSSAGLPQSVLNNPEYPGALCDDKHTASYSEDALKLAPSSGDGPKSSFTITDEGPRSSTPEGSSACSVIFYDRQSNVIQLFIVMLTTPS